MNERTPITAPAAPPAVGPYSQAIRHGDLVFCSGALPLDPESGELVDDSIAAEAEQCLRNIAAVCEAAGTELGRVLRTTVFTTDLDSFGEINAAYEAFFPSAPPARAAVGVGALPKGARVEIDAIAAVG
jgi:2-iminobutanoate/2-iminopropanoate deaminase